MASRTAAMRALFVGVGINYGPNAGPDAGRVHVYKGPDWSSMTRCQEIIPGDGCAAIEWVELHPSGKTLYAMCCYWGFKPVLASEQKPGKLYAFPVDPKTAQLGEPKIVNSGGHHPCHGAVSIDATKLAVAHFLCGSTAVWDVDPDTGAVLSDEPVILSLPHVDGSPTDSDRLLGTNTGPLARGVCFSPCGRWLVVCDAGQDQVVVWRINEETGESQGKFAFASATRLEIPLPRHSVFSSSGDVLYILHEFKNVLSSHNFDSESGTLDAVPIAKASTVTNPETAGVQLSSALVSLTDDLLVVSNRAFSFPMLMEKFNKAAGTEANVCVFDARTMERLASIEAGVVADFGDARECVTVPQSLGGGLLVGLQSSEKVLYFPPHDGPSGLSTSAVSIDKVVAPLALAVMRVSD